MLSLNRRFLLKASLALPLGAGLSACGFSPVYGPAGTGTALTNQVQVQAPETIASPSKPDSYFLVRQLESRLGRGHGGDYKLGLTIHTRQEGQAITAEGDITRYSLIGQVEYRLVRVFDGQVVASGTVKNFSGYSASGTTVQTLASENDSHERLMVLLADQIVTQLFATADLAPGSPSPQPDAAAHQAHKIGPSSS